MSTARLLSPPSPGTTSSLFAFRLPRHSVSQIYKGQRIYANTNLNSLVSPGMYRCMLYADAASLSNTPVKWPFNLLVLDPIGGSGYCTQILAHNGGSDLVGLYIRAEYGGTWSEWKQL